MNNANSAVSESHLMMELNSDIRMPYLVVLIFNIAIAGAKV